MRVHCSVLTTPKAVSPLTQTAAPYSFDICEDTGGAGAFFPSGQSLHILYMSRTRLTSVCPLGCCAYCAGHTALTGSFTEVSCSEWSGSDESQLWSGACLSGESAGFWPSSTGCGNQGGLFSVCSLRVCSWTDWGVGTAPS